MRSKRKDGVRSGPKPVTFPLTEYVKVWLLCPRVLMQLGLRGVAALVEGMTGGGLKEHRSVTDMKEV